ncbi:MAG: hypothetical protein IPM14_05210 [bacterium]|nr:hypothetical protein [bacterium]
MQNVRKDAPSLKEKSALEKATGQSPQPESKKDSEPHIQPLDNDTTVAALFQAGQAISSEIDIPSAIKSVNKDLRELNMKEKPLAGRLDEINSLLKPESRELKKIQGLGKQNSPTVTERKNLRVERKKIERQLFLIREEKAKQGKRLSDLTGSAIRKESKGLLYDKANADNYLKRNKHLIKAKMLKAINTFRQTSGAEEISYIRRLARATDPDGLKLFKQEFGAILEAIDVETYILCSGLLSDVLYSASRLTFLSKSASFKGVFEELVMPEEE